MSYNYETDFKPLEDQGLTDVQIASQLQSDTRHFKNIMATGDAAISGTAKDLHHFLVAKYNVLRIGSDATWKGPLVDYMDALPNDNVLRIGFENLLSQLQITNRPVFCGTHAPTGYLVTAIAGIVDGMAQQMGHDAGAVVADINSVTGGPRWTGLSEQVIADARSEYIAQVNSPARQWQRYVTGGATLLESDPNATFEQIKAAGEAAV